MADIANGSLYMAAADKAAAAVELIINGQVADVIDQAVAEGLITNAKGIMLKKRGKKIAAHVVELVIGHHSDLIDAAQEAGIDLPAPADGAAELVGVIEGMVSPFGGGGR